MTSELAPACPICNSPMRRRHVTRGRRAGLDMWGCSRWPNCRGAINIDPDADAEAPIERGEPARYAQVIFERARERDLLKRRAALPLFVGMAILVMTIVWYAAQPFGTTIAAGAAAVVGLVFVGAFIRLPLESFFWAKGIEGEQKTAAFLEPLESRGFIVLFNRLLPTVPGDIDSLVIGPTGVFLVETKNWKRKVDVRGGRLLVDEVDRTHVLREVSQRAIAVQVALGEVLTVERATVTPVLCAIGGLGVHDATGAGVLLTDGNGLARLIAERPTVLRDDTVQRIARLADQRMRQRRAWETT